MGKLINRTPGLCLLISSLPGSALRTHVESLDKPHRCQQALSKPCLVNLISKDTHLVLSIYKLFVQFNFHLLLELQSYSIISMSKINFLISEPKHMFWLLKRTVSLRRFFEHPKQVFKLMDKKKFTIDPKYFGLNHRPSKQILLAYNYYNYLIHKFKRMFWVLKKNVSLRRFF